MARSESDQRAKRLRKGQGLPKPGPKPKPKPKAKRALFDIRHRAEGRWGVLGLYEVSVIKFSSFQFQVPVPVTIPVSVPVVNS